MRIYTPTYTGLSSQPRGIEVEPDVTSPIRDRSTPSPIVESLLDNTQPPIVRSERKVGLQVAVISVLMAAAAWLRTRHQHA
jgi:hypothetical protein